MVRAMVAATLEGIQYTMDHPQEAFEISKKYVENLASLPSADQQVQEQVLAASIQLWQPDPLGYSQPQAWQNMQDNLLEMGLLKTPQDLEQAYTNRFLPE